MTEELNLLREALRRVKHEAASLADAQVIALEALTQRPAAQTEREAFEAWFDDYYDKACAEFGGIDCTDPKGIAEDAWQAHASLPAPQQATPEPVGDVRCEGCGYMTHHREHMGCVRAAKQHTHPAPGVPEGSALFMRALLQWAVGRWQAEVQDRPMVNKNRRTLDDTWRQVIRFAGGNPDALVGPSHDDMLAAAQAKGADK